MNLGLLEIIIIIVAIVVLFGVVKLVGDKRYFRRPKGNAAAAKDKTNQ